MRRLYYDRHGNQISAELALDANGILKEGVTQRVSLMKRDAQSSRLTDGFGDSSELALSRPGFRCLADAAARDAREAAYQQYEDELVNAWKAPQGLGNDKLGRRS